MALNLTLRKVYLYAFAAVGLILLVVSLISLINLGLKVYVFKNADSISYYAPVMTKDPNGNDLTTEQTAAQQKQQEEQDKKQRTAEHEREASIALAQLIVGLPLFIYHWRLIKKENQV